MKAIAHLGLFCALLALPALVQAQFTYVTNNGTITIVKYRGSDGTVVVPESIGGLPVTCIGNGAFWSKSSLTSVTIPNGVTNIGEGAFLNCSSLASVTIPPSVTCIGDNAFYPCPSLTNVSSAKGLVKVSGGWRTEEEQDRITKDRAQQEEAQRRQEAKQTELVAKQAAYDEAQVAKGLVKVNGKWFRKVVCSSCRGKECGYVYTRAAWIDSGPYAAPVYIPPARGRGQCSACGGTGYVLQEATE